jgi:preprotein translocase subunit SecF
MPHPDGRRHTFRDLYHENTHFRFLDRKWRWAVLSGIVLLAGLLGFVLRGGLNLGIDFEGGTAWQFTTAAGKAPSSGGVRSVMEAAGVSDPKVQLVGERGVRVQAKDLKQAQQDKVTSALAKYAGIQPSSVSVNDVGPTWGQQVSAKALRALVIFFIVIALYLTFRFEMKMAIAAIVAVLHDILVTVSVYAVTGFEVTPATVIAFLTILGFSLYDTVVVFDKIQENAPGLQAMKDETYTDMANRSLNQVLMRSLNTSFVALLPVASLLVVGVWIYGALALREFGLALFVGLLTGAYSSIFVATPILAYLKEREPRYRALRERVAVRGGRATGPVLATVGAPAGPAVEGDGETVAEAPERPTGGVAGPPAVPRTPGGLTPRPRQQRRRKRR